MKASRNDVTGDERAAARAGIRERLVACRGSYLRLCLQSLRATRSWELTERVLAWSRRARLVRRILTVLLTVWQIVQTGAALLFLLAAALVVLPLLILVFAGALPAILLTDRRVVKRLTARCDGRTVLFFFPTDAQLTPDGFFARNVASLAAPGRIILLILPPRLTSPDGSVFFCSRKLDERVYVLRRHTYLRLRRTLETTPHPPRRVIQCF